MSSTTPIGARERNRQRTRQRIVEAAMELHTTVGPARTTVMGIAERAGGRVWIDSTLGAGTTVSGLLPLAPAPRTAGADATDPGA